MITLIDKLENQDFQAIGLLFLTKESRNVKQGTQKKILWYKKTTFTNIYKYYLVLRHYSLIWIII